MRRRPTIISKMLIGPTSWVLSEVSFIVDKRSVTQESQAYHLEDTYRARLANGVQIRLNSSTNLQTWETDLSVVKSMNHHLAKSKCGSRTTGAIFSVDQIHPQSEMMRNRKKNMALMTATQSMNTQLLAVANKRTPNRHRKRWHR